MGPGAEGSQLRWSRSTESAQRVLWAHHSWTRLSRLDLPLRASNGSKRLLNVLDVCDGFWVGTVRGVHTTGGKGRA